MAIKTPTVPGQTKPGPIVVPPVADPEIPVEIPRHGGDGRPKIRQGATATFGYYSRASSFGKAIADTYNLDRWDKRVVVFGLSRDPSLVLAAQAVPAFEDKTDARLHKQYREQLDAIVDRAREVAKSDRAALRGTALHTLSEQADAGADLSHLDATTTRALDMWRRMMGMFRILATETFVVNDQWRAAGSFDRLAELLVEVTIRDGDGNVLAVLPAGTVVIVDLKTGRTSDFFGIEYAVQLAVYALGCPYVHVEDDQVAADPATGRPADDGRRPWPGGVAPSAEWALIPHVPVDNPDEAGLMWVDLSVGRRCADLVVEVKDARKAAKGAFYAGEILDLPAAAAGGVRVVENDAEGFVEVMLELIGAAANLGEIERLYDHHAADWRPEFTAAVTARMAQLDTAPPAPAAPADAGEWTQVRLVEAIRATTTEEQLDELYRVHADRWTGYVGKVASQHIRDLDAHAARVAS